MIVSTSIHSQNTSSTNITYDKLQEFAKYVIFKDSASILFQKFKIELITKDNLIDVKDSKINLLSLSLQKSDSIVTAQNNLLELSDIKFKAQSKKKYVWFGGGVLAGLIFMLIVSK